MRDYLKLLRHLMQIHGKLQWMSLFSDIDINKVTYHTAGRKVTNAILKAETVHDVFVPALPEKGVKSFSEFVMSEASWSTSLAICTSDLTGRRRKGSCWCMSMSSIALNKSLSN
jgi:DNA-binding protein